MRPHVLHLITGLRTGGAETMLYKFLSRTRMDSLVVSMTDEGALGARIRSLGVPLLTLGMHRGVPDPRAFRRLISLLREHRPHLLQSWMYHADVMGSLAAWRVGGVPVIWNVRQSTLDLASSKHGTIWTFRLAAVLSRWLPERIVCCSETGRRAHAAIGYADNKLVVIPNGFDLSTFHPDPEARVSVRRELGVPAGAVLIGLVARLDPQKDHRTFVDAAARLGAERSDVHFVLCGDDVTPNNPRLTGWTGDTGLADRFHLLGRRTDIPRITAALDVATSSSYQEGFPNVIGEAMACGVPCVVTNAGDSAEIVGDAGIVVPPRDPRALADGWRTLLAQSPDERTRAGQTARRRVEQRYSIERVAAMYEQLYEDSICSGRGTVAPGGAHLAQHSAEKLWR